MQQLFSPTRPSANKPNQTQLFKFKQRSSASSAVAYAAIAIVVAGLLFAFSYTSARQFSQISDTFSCFASIAQCKEGVCDQPGESVECTSSAQCKVHSMQCQQTTAGLYDGQSCDNECERSFACVDRSCELVGPGRGSYGDLTCDSECD